MISHLLNTKEIFQDDDNNVCCNQILEYLYVVLLSAFQIAFSHFHIFPISNNVY